jgi:hypothetical protein
MSKAIAGTKSEVVTVSAPNNTVLIVTTPKAMEVAATKVVDATVYSGTHAAKVEINAKTLAAVEYRYRRMFRASSTVRALLGDDAPDLYGKSSEFLAAKKAINEAARGQIAQALMDDGVSAKAAMSEATLALDVIRKSVSREYRILVDSEFRKSLPAARAELELLAHGFKRNSQVPNNLIGENSELAPTAKSPETLALKPPAPTTPANQTGKGDTGAEDRKALLASIESTLKRHDSLGLLESARGFIGQATGLLPGEDKAVAARAIVDLQRSVNALIKAWGLTTVQLKAANEHAPHVPSVRSTMTEEARIAADAPEVAAAAAILAKEQGTQVAS